MAVTALSDKLKKILNGTLPGGVIGQVSERYGLGTIIANIITLANANETTAGAAIPKAAFTTSGRVLEATGAGTYAEVAGATAATASTYVKRDASANILGALLSGTRLQASIAPGANEAAAGEFAHYDPLAGADIRVRAVRQAGVSVNTGGAATALTLNIPVGAVVLGGGVKIATEITNANSTTVTLALTGGSTDTITTVSALTAGTKSTALIAPSAVTSSVANAAVTLSGGGDNTPDGGTVDVIVWYMTIDALD